MLHLSITFTHVLLCIAVCQVKFQFCEEIEISKSWSVSYRGSHNEDNSDNEVVMRGIDPRLFTVVDKMLLKNEAPMKVLAYLNTEYT